MRDVGNPGSQKSGSAPRAHTADASAGAARTARIPGGPDGRRMLWIALVDKSGTGLWAGAAALYFTTVSGLGIAEVGLLLSLSGAVGIAGSPLAGRIADRVPLTRLLVALQLVRALGALALFTTDAYGLLLLYAAVGSLGDRAANVVTKLYAARVTGPDRVRYQAVNRTVSNIGFSLGGLAAAAALAVGTAAAYRSLLLGDALSYLAVAALTLRCGEPPAPSRVVASSDGVVPAAPASPWRDRTYLLYTASDAVLSLHDSVFRVGIPLWIVHATAAPEGLAPLLMVLNSGLVVFCQVPLARFGATTAAARNLLRPLAGTFLVSTLALAASAAGGPWAAVTALTVAAVTLTLAEMLHSVVSWEFSVALAPGEAQGAYLGVHGLAQSAQRSGGPLAVTAAVAAGPAAWLAMGVLLAATCWGQRRLVRDHPATPEPVAEPKPKPEPKPEPVAEPASPTRIRRP
ncbi:MFS transporter [Streptomyces sp. KCTC 0041BP]|uniref:MFS transporter n=1 Tax=Streptomyces sp. KCTC 0041BP TaxID=201500 RepID=UPI0024743B1A|nr:MFS transporter [Streptomyces sp. KCTC 0041BP]